MLDFVIAANATEPPIIMAVVISVPHVIPTATPAAVVPKGMAIVLINIAMAEIGSCSMTFLIEIGAGMASGKLRLKSREVFLWNKSPHLSQIFSHRSQGSHLATDLLRPDHEKMAASNIDRREGREFCTFK